MGKLRSVFVGILLVLALVLQAGCSKKKQIWIYTSLYKELIAEMDPALHQQFPDVEIKWYQGGSENVATKVNAELAAGKTKADLIMTSDPFWYYELKKNGKFLTYDSPAAKGVPAEYRDPDHAFDTVRMPVMVIGYNSESIKADEAPKSWKDLSLPKWKGKVSMGSPLESGTMFTMVALTSKLYSWDFFQKLRALDLVASGSNTSVISRVETQERPIGVVLIENVLKAQAKGSPVKTVYPTDGTIPIPSPIAIFKDTEHPEEAKKIYDWFFGEIAQKAIVHGGMYSVVPGMPSPDNAKPWAELQKNMMKWTPEVLEQIYSARDQIKGKFSEVVWH